jgi:hypothetical protein
VFGFEPTYLGLIRFCYCVFFFFVGRNSFKGGRGITRVVGLGAGAEPAKMFRVG